MGKLTRIIAVAGLLGGLAPLLVGASAFAQAGSTGGSIGKTNKAVGGGEAAPAPRARSQARAPKPRARSRAVEPGSGVRSGSADGIWVVSATPSCLPSWTLTASVSNGVITAISGGSATGHVSRNGGVKGSGSVLGFIFDFVGHFRGQQASGTLFAGAQRCPGHWTAVKS